MLGRAGQTRQGFGYRPSVERAGLAARAHVRPSPRLRRRAPIAVALGWGAAGFLLGAAFWIYLGVHELTGQGVGRAPAPGCTALTLDRHSGRTTAAPCPSRAPLHDSLTALLGPSARP